MSVPALEFQGVTLRFGDHVAIEDVSFAASEGSFIAVVGPNGAGKSSLLRVALGLFAATQGAVRIFGRAARDADPQVVGYVPQVKTLDRTFPALTEELVATGLTRRWPGWLEPSQRATVAEALTRVGADHLRGRPIATLSGGEVQRVYLARSIARRPKLILLDEPGAGLDVEGAKNMYEVLEEFQRESGSTVIMVTHDWEGAFHHASSVLLLNRRLVAFGPPHEALHGDKLSEAFGHLGHGHPATFGAHDHD
jgi:zinc transport system ATP-binding protein